jgi:signal peptidase I
VVIVALAVAATITLDVYRVPSASMEPTLSEGDHIAVNKHSDDPDVGDVIAFYPPVGALGGRACAVRPRRGQVCGRAGRAQSDVIFIKRVVATGGDRLAVRGGIPVVDGEAVEGDWEIRACSGSRACDFPTPVTIPPEHLFIMGDNRGASSDSRFWGPVPRDWIVGEAIVRYWPPGDFGGL